MQVDEWAIGENIAVNRVKRGLTQEELAGLVGISLSMMKKIESGDRLVTRFSQIVLFAQALRIKDLHELTGVPLSLLPDGSAVHPAAAAIRAALTEYAVPEVEPPVLSSLGLRIDRTWQAWQSPSPWRYAQVGQELPALIREARAAVALAEGADRRLALREASKLYQLVRTWTKRANERELSWIAADRAVAAALEADDPDLAAAAAWNLGMILSTRGHTDEARTVVYQAIRQLQPGMADASDRRLAIWGGLHLLGASEAARDDQDTEAWRMLDLAHLTAGRTGETNHFRVVFGPTNVALHRVSIAVELGRTRDALDLAERVVIEQAPAVERRLTFHLDAARSYVRTRNDVAAVHMLQRVHHESPEELRYSSLTRETLRVLRQRAKPAIASDLRPLLEAAGLTE